LHPDKI
jgi:hypothetical protein